MTIATLADYRELTGDTYSTAEQVEAMLPRAEAIVVRRTGRGWALATYTEVLRIYQNGIVYPSDSPIQSVSDPAGASITPDGAGIGSGSWDWPTVNVQTDFFSDNRWPTVSVTYVGGYSVGQFPEELVAVQCEIVLYKLNPPQLTGVPAGTQQIKVSTRGQGFSGVRMGGSSALPPSIRATLRELQVRRV